MKNQNSANLRTNISIAANAACPPLHVRRYATQPEHIACHTPSTQKERSSGGRAPLVQERLADVCLQL